MEDIFSLHNCCDHDALSFQSGMYKVGKVRQAVQQAFKGTVANALYDSLKFQGVNIDPRLSKQSRDSWFSQGSLDPQML